jgi:hypothetical protein
VTAGFSTFTNDNVSIFKPTPTIVNTELSAEVDIDAFIYELSNNTVTDSIKFTNGQDFRICVKPIVNDMTPTFILLVDLNQ